MDLEFTKKNPNALQRVISFLNWGPNGYATGFLVGNHLVMTAYHVVSGDLDESKKLALGFSRTDDLEARVYTNGCQAKVLGVDVNADLALLEVCGTAKQTNSPSFQLNLSKDERLMLIARPHGDKVISHPSGLSDRPLALLPVRLETRFFPQPNGSSELRVRVYPDKIHLDSHDDGHSTEVGIVGEQSGVAATGDGGDHAIDQASRRDSRPPT